MATIYVPDSLLAVVEKLKMAAKHGWHYHLTLDGKEETENEEKLSPHTPFIKEEKEKEERGNGKGKEKKSKKKFFSLDNFSEKEMAEPTLEAEMAERALKEQMTPTLEAEMVKPTLEEVIVMPAFESEMVKPTLEEVLEYHQQKGFNGFSAEEFYYYYDAFGWKSKDGKPVVHWKALMNTWRLNRERYNSKMHGLEQGSGQMQQQGIGQVQQGNEQALRGTLLPRGKKESTKHETTLKQLQQQVIAYLEEHYAVADTNVENVVANGMGMGATIGEMTKELGWMAVLRLIIKHLLLTGWNMDTSQRKLMPEKLDIMAKELLSESYGLTIQDLLLFLKQCRQGYFDNFVHGLKTTTLLRSLSKFKASRARSVNVYCG